METFDIMDVLGFGLFLHLFGLGYNISFLNAV